MLQRPRKPVVFLVPVVLLVELVEKSKQIEQKKAMKRLNLPWEYL